MSRLRRAVPFHRVGAVVALGGVVPLSACDILAPAECPSVGAFSLSVTAFDAETGEPVTEELRGVAARGSDRDGVR